MEQNYMNSDKGNVKSSSSQPYSLKCVMAQIYKASKLRFYNINVHC